jgi:uncharacterized membrane protein YhaH (DUF805 family)
VRVVVVDPPEGGMVGAARRAERDDGDDMDFTHWYVSRGRITRRTWWLHHALVFAGLTMLLVQNGFLRGDGGPNRYGPAPGRRAAVSHMPQS